jgi:hypothetical protein
MNETSLAPTYNKKGFAQLQITYSLDPMNISTAFLKMIPQQIFAPMTHIFNFSVATGEIPIQLKTAKIEPTYQSGHQFEMKNYCLISLLSSFPYCS